MKISTKVRYGMRAMVELARRNDEAPVMLKSIAKNQKLSEKYLEQLFTLLRNAGLVKSERGSKGGYRLAKKADDITAYDVFIAMNGPLELVDCVVSKDFCDRIHECNTRCIWKHISDAVIDILKSRTLLELARIDLDNIDYII